MEIVNTTCLLEFKQPLNIKTILNRFPCTKLTGSPRTFSWNVQGFQLTVSKESFNMTKTELPISMEKLFCNSISAIRSVNNFYSSNLSIYDFVNSNPGTCLKTHFASVTWKLQPHFEGSAMIYKNGKCVLVGCKNIKSIESSVDYLVRKLATIHENISPPKVSVKNIVKTVNLGHTFNLTKLHLFFERKLESSYYPELFPAIHICIHPIKLTLFSTGIVILTGSSNEQDHEKAYEKILQTTNAYIEQDLKNFIAELTNELFH